MDAFTVLPVASSLHGAETTARIIGGLRSLLSARGATIGDRVGRADATTPLAILVVTGGTEQYVLQVIRERHQVVPGEPVLLLAHPDHNSLPAALEALGRLQRDHQRGRIVVLRDGRSDQLLAAVHDHAVWHALHRARIGLVGEPSDWLVASTPNPSSVRHRWGVGLVEVGMAGTLHRYADNAEGPLAEPVSVGARHVHEPTPADIADAARFEPVLTATVDRERLDAVAVRCFDLVLDAHTSGCLALSALNDAGVIAGCEGDVASTLALLWAKHLTGQLGWMANPAVIDSGTGIIELAHCTVPRSLVTGYDLRSHFESGLGVAIAGELPPGPVTLFRLGGAELELLWCAEGEALATDPRPDRCRTQLDVQVPPARAAELLAHPLGNHLVMVNGHHADRLTAWWRTMIA
jgi:L-fucose isomerase-like protein